MQINVTYDPSVSGAPAGFEADIQAAVQYLDTEFTNPITINIDVGYGEVHGIPLGPNTLGASEVSHGVPESYSTVVNALVAEGAPGSSTLPASPPAFGTLLLSPAQAKALGLIPDDNNIDGYVGFSAAPNTFSYAVGTPPPANEFYFVDTVEHEITEVIGRLSLVDLQPFAYSVMDLFRYSAPGVRDLTVGGKGSTAYFSIDNGVTNLGTWNNNPFHGDLGDWFGSNIPNGGHDAFSDFATPGVIEGVSPNDILLMEALGWTSIGVPATISAQDFSVVANETVPISSFVTVTNIGGDNITDYLFEDLGGGSGYLTVDGTPVPDGQQIDVSNLTSVQYVGGSAAGTDTLQAEILDATTNSFVSSKDFAATTTQFPQNPGNVDEWILSNGQLAAAAGPGSSPTGYQFAGIGDFNDDGTSDVLWFKAANSDVVEWQMSNGAVANTIDLGAHPSAYYVAGVGDFNGDGTSDILWFNPTTGQTDIWEMSGGQWASSSSLGAIPGAGWQLAAIGDFNGDGTSDILWHNVTSGDVAEWQISNGHWAGSVDFGAAPAGLQIAGAGKFFGNNAPSGVLWFNASTGETDIWEMSNGHWAGTINVGTIPGSGWQVAGIGDFTGNGTDDILWHNVNSGDVAEWILQNGHWAGSVDLGTVSGWQVIGVGDFTGSGTSDILWHTST